ncbi:hypothetical protein CSA08_01850 [Candidatus Gracilibacteria bacterium]|nr:MAG: hypothetical protein CSA08_01850 [Candidatus Gracilibacteria bacterium]
MSLPTDLYKKKKKSSYIFSLLFLALVLILTLALYLYNSNITEDIAEVNEEIKVVDSLIENIKKDEKLQIYSLIETNKKPLEILEYNSQIPDYIEHFKNIGQKYKIDLKSFSYSAGKITTSVTFNQENEVTYLRVVNFLRDYRQSPDSLFDLDFVKSVSGNDTITFNISLTLKDLSKRPIVKNELVNEQAKKQDNTDSKEDIDSNKENLEGEDLKEENKEKIN